MSQGYTKGIPIDTDGTLSADSDLLVPSQKAVKTYVDNATPSDASTTVKGVTKLSVAPVLASNPIAVGDNDPRNSDARTPTAHAATHTNGTDDIQTASALQKGLLSSADWSTFNSKQPAATGTPDGTKFLRDDNSWQTLPSQLVSINLVSGGGAVTLTNQVLAASFFNNSNRHITRYDLTGYTEAKLICRVNTASASPNNPILYIRYKTVASGFTTVVGDYLQMGATEISNSMDTATVIDSGWINLVAGAKADVYIGFFMSGGDAIADPTVGFCNMFFR